METKIPSIGKEDLIPFLQKLQLASAVQQGIKAQIAEKMEKMEKDKSLHMGLASLLTLALAMYFVPSLVRNTLTSLHYGISLLLALLLLVNELWYRRNVKRSEQEILSLQAKEDDFVQQHMDLFGFLEPSDEAGHMAQSLLHIAQTHEGISLEDALDYYDGRVSGRKAEMEDESL